MDILEQAEAIIREKYVSMRDGLLQYDGTETDDVYAKGMIRGLSFALAVITQLQEQKDKPIGVR